MKKTLFLAFASVAAISAASQAHAGGFYLQEQSTRGTGRAYSGEVADQGVESLWWNPAAIARSPREAYLGVSGVFVDGTVRNTGSTITYPGGTTLPVTGEPRAYNPIEQGAVPNFAIATPIGDRFAIGFSAAAPYNFTTKYDSAAWTRYDALTSKLLTTDLQLTGAMKVTDWLDLGASVNTEYTKARLSQAYPNLPSAAGLSPDALSSLKGHGWNWGWTAGAQAHFDKLTLGASYRSKMDHDLDGTASVSGLLGPLAAANLNGKGSASFTTPWIATLGLRYALTDRLTLDGQVQRVGWGEFDNITVQTLAGTQVLAQDYKDVTSGGVGFDYAVNDRFTVRAGVQYDPTPTPDNERTARVPDGDRWLFGTGATAQITPAMKLDLALAYVDFKNSDVNHDQTFYAGTAAATTSHLRGVVEGEGYIMSVGLRTQF